jgi:hypothetical protein
LENNIQLWGQQFTAISDSDIRIVKHARANPFFFTTSKLGRRGTTPPRLA